MNFANVSLTGSNGAVYAQNAGLKIKLPDEIARRLDGHNTREVILGIRPEDLTLAGPGDSADLSFEGVAEVVEQLGSEIILDMKVGDGMMVASVEPNVKVKMHDTLRLAMRPSRLHVFDKTSEAAI